jgi:hypothetical protein
MNERLFDGRRRNASPEALAPIGAIGPSDGADGGIFAAYKACGVETYVR